MNSKTSIKIKATLLITVFSLNSVFGFACSMGLDMGYNKSHHTEEAIEVSVHAHGDGKKHLHNKKENVVNENVINKNISKFCKSFTNYITSK